LLLLLSNKSPPPLEGERFDVALPNREANISDIPLKRSWRKFLAELAPSPKDIPVKNVSEVSLSVFSTSVFGCLEEMKLVEDEEATSPPPPPGLNNLIHK
jgi:hypothetical protein